MSDWRNAHLGLLSEEIKTQKSICNMILIFKKENLSAQEVQGGQPKCFRWLSKEDCRWLTLFFGM